MPLKPATSLTNQIYISREKTDLPPEIQAFWEARKDLTIIDDVIMNGSRIVIPTSIHQELLKVLVAAH